MTDEFEIRYGLNPCSPEGVNGLAGDFDGDFLSNDKEREYNTNLSVPDSDCDGVVDGLETGSVFATNTIPWLAFDAYEDITLAISADYNRCINRPLPVPMCIQGERVTNVTIYASGAICLNKAGYDNPGYSVSGSNFKSIVNRSAFVLAPYLQSAYIRSDIADRQTSIKYGTATFDGVGYILVEYLNSFYSTSSSQTDSISFQIAIPTNTADRAYSRYLDVTGQYMDGRYARKHNVVTDFGKLMDPIADKILIVAAFVMLSCMRDEAHPNYLLHPILTIVFIAREFLISGVRLIAAAKGVVISAGKLGKWKTTLQDIIVIALLLYDEFPFFYLNPVLRIIVEVLVYVALALSVLSAADYLIKNKGVLNLNDC